MLCICKYNPLADLSPVSQTGYINLSECLANNVVPTTIDNEEVAYNQIEDPNEILGSPKDVFEAFRMAGYVNDSGKKEGESGVAAA